MDFEKTEGLSDLPEKDSGELPQWIKDNLEAGGARESELPDWIVRNLDTDAKEKLEEGRELSCIEILEGVFREFFGRIFGTDERTEEVSHLRTDTTELPSVVLTQSDREETSDTVTPADRYQLSAATDQWHYQLEDYSCANACQTFIINEYLDRDVDEAQLNELARQKGWYQEYGTAFDDIGNLLEVYGIEAHRTWGADFQDVQNALNQGDRVIVCVYNAALDDDWGDQFPVASANHAVEVLGIDDSNPNDIKVIVNDPGVADGCGKAVSLETFNRARETSYGYMVVAERP